MGQAPVQGLLGGGDDVAGVAAVGFQVDHVHPGGLQGPGLGQHLEGGLGAESGMRSASSMTGYKAMRDHEVRVQRPGERFPREQEPAWRLAEVVPVEPVAEMAANRVLDDVAVAVAALDRDLPAAARAQALAHPAEGGATVLGLGPGTQVAAEWAAWANGTAVRELDFHDTFLAADFAHPGDNIPPLLAVAQQCRRSGPTWSGRSSPPTRSRSP